MISSKVMLDVRGFNCPTPTLKMSNFLTAGNVTEGDTLVVLADCDTFEADVRRWCKLREKVLLVFKHLEDDAMQAEIRI